MKRAIPQKVKPVPSCATESDIMTGQPRQSLPEANRRVRTSAAMIGLAISVSAHGLLLPQQGDEVLAAEPIAGEAAADPAVADLAAIPSPGDGSPATSSASVVEHTVQEGQTLWQLAQFYGVSASSLAAANAISVNSVLHVGQVLQIPVDGRIADSRISEAAASDNAEGRLPAYYGPIKSAVPVEASSGSGIKSIAAVEAANSQDSTLELEQNAALTRLKEKRGSLQASLNKLKAAKFPVSSAAESSIEVPTVDLAPSSGGSTEYQVVAGDTLSTIARAHGVSQQELQAANQLVDPNVLLVNQVLVIPGGTSASSVPEAPSIVSANIATPEVSPVPVVSATSETSSVPRITSGNPQVFIASAPGRSTSKTAPVVSSQFKAKIASLPVEMGSSLGADVQNTPAPEVKVATAPFAGNSSIEARDASAKLRFNYVENLRLEIVKLREKYRNSEVVSSRSNNVPARKVAASSLNVAVESGLSTAVNPEFSSSGETTSLRSQIRKLQGKGSDVAPTAASEEVTTSARQSGVRNSKPQLVAAAPIGSPNYDSLIPSSVGQMVSPNLPPLGSIDSYLPSSNGKFAGYIWPARGVLTSGYGWRWGRMHRGIDIAAPIGTPVVAAAPGVVITAGWNSGGYGNLVEIKHPDGSVTLYAHNNRILVREGQQVEQGQQIAEMGSTGYSTGPHSHFEVHIPGQGAVNPIAYLPRSGA